MSTKKIGDRGEQLAAAYLEAQGYIILARQYRFMKAEVDLVCFEPAARYEDGGELVFVEVKTRSGTGFGRPEEAVTEAKKRNMAVAPVRGEALDAIVAKAMKTSPALVNKFKKMVKIDKLKPRKRKKKQ